MTARKNFRFPTDMEGGLETEYRAMGASEHLIRMLIERDQRLEDFLGTLHPADSGVATVTTDVAGRAVIAHGLRFTPRVVAAGSMGPDSGGSILASVIVTALTATTFTVRLLDQTGTALVSTAGLTFGWIASL